MKKKILLVSTILAGALAVTACGQTTLPGTIKVESEANQVITVESSEKVKVVPDIAEVVFGVYSQAASAEECQSLNKTELDKVLSLLTDSGIEETSIQTSGYGMDPIYDWDTGKTVTGYEMTTNVVVSDIPIDSVGGLLSDCVDAGVNNIQSVSYLSSQYDESYQEALGRAIESAKLKAQAIADAGNCALGEIAKVTEIGDYSEARYTNYQRSAYKTEAVADAAMGVMPGQISVEAQVSVEFAIQAK